MFVKELTNICTSLHASWGRNGASLFHIVLKESETPALPRRLEEGGGRQLYRVSEGEVARGRHKALLPPLPTFCLHGFIHLQLLYSHPHLMSEHGYTTGDAEKSWPGLSP